MSLNRLYQQEIMDHFQHPLNFGALEGADFISPEQNPSCGDKIVVYGKVKDQKLISVMFEGSGCVISVAMASKLTEYCKNKSLEEVLVLDQDCIKQLLGMDLGPKRMQCALLSVFALQKGIKLLKT